MSVEKRPLTVVRVELVPVGLVHQHEVQGIVLMEQFKAIQIIVQYLNQLLDLCLGLSKSPAAVVNPNIGDVTLEPKA